MGVLPKQGIANVYKENRPLLPGSNWKRPTRKRAKNPRWSPWRAAKDLPIVVEKPAASEVLIGRELPSCKLAANSSILGLIQNGLVPDFLHLLL